MGQPLANAIKRRCRTGGDLVIAYAAAYGVVDALSTRIIAHSQRLDTGLSPLFAIWAMTIRKACRLLALGSAYS